LNGGCFWVTDISEEVSTDELEDVSRFASHIAATSGVLSSRKNKTRQGKTRQDKTRQDKTRQDKTRQDKTRQGKARQGKTRQDKIKTKSRQKSRKNQNKIKAQHTTQIPGMLT
jgi:hypothetical protein